MKELRILAILEVLTWITFFLLLVGIPALLGLWLLATLTGTSLTVVLLCTIDEEIDKIERGF